jgi:hypothetical protein
MTSLLLLANITGFPTVVGFLLLMHCASTVAGVPMLLMHCASNVAGVPSGIGNPAVAVVPAIADVPADVMTSGLAPRSDYYHSSERRLLLGIILIYHLMHAMQRKDEL